MAVVERRLTVVGKGTVTIIVITIIIILGLQTLKQIPAVIITQVATACWFSMLSLTLLRALLALIASDHH